MKGSNHSFEILEQCCTVYSSPKVPFEPFILESTNTDSFQCPGAYPESEKYSNIVYFLHHTMEWSN